jgi:hypothetical protein
MTASVAQSATHLAEKTAAALERHYSPEELATTWSISADTVRRLFEEEPGVLVIEKAKQGSRRYRTLRIPESVAIRVHRRMTNVVAMPNR